MRAGDGRSILSPRCAYAAAEHDEWRRIVDQLWCGYRQVQNNTELTKIFLTDARMWLPPHTNARTC